MTKSVKPLAPTPVSRKNPRIGETYRQLVSKQRHSETHSLIITQTKNPTFPPRPPIRNTSAPTFSLTRYPPC
jgi:hypothetical protein